MLTNFHTLKSLRGWAFSRHFCADPVESRLLLEACSDGASTLSDGNTCVFIVQDMLSDLDLGLKTTTAKTNQDGQAI